MNPGVAPMPTIGGNAANLQNDVNTLAPLASTWSGANNGVPIAQNLPTATSAPSGSAAAKFFGFLGGIATSTGHIASAAATWIGHETKDMALAPVHYVEGINRGFNDRTAIHQISAQTQQYSQELQTLHEQYKSGQISSADYQKGLKNLGDRQNDLVKQSVALDNRVKLDQSQAYQATINTAADVVTLLSFGIGRALSQAAARAGAVSLDTGTMSVADFVTSRAADPLFQASEAMLSHVATNSEAFKALDSISQWAVQHATAEVVAINAPMTSAQIARTAAVNLALKYPLTFSALSSTGKQVYQELDQAKYGDAIRTIAFNALLLLSGGPIGHALQYGGDLLKGVNARTFGQTAFWDELSKFYGDGSTNGFTQAVSKMLAKADPAAQQELLRNLGAVEATNVGAVAGDSAAAAYRVARGMTEMYGFDLKTVTHEQGLQDMVNYAKAYRLANEAAQEAGVPGLAIGRVDSRALEFIASNVATGPDNQARLALWDNMKKTNPNAAWANNGNLDKQIKRIISSSDNPEALVQSIRSIPSGALAKGLPPTVKTQLAKMGYVPIQPRNLEAPFREGSGKFLTAHAPANNAFFVKAVQPLPILQAVGDTLTALGLNPNTSTHRVYDLFNDNLAANLKKTGVITSATMVNDDPAQTSDRIIKALSDYAHSPTRGGIQVGQAAHIRPPITDLRQLTTRDIQEALKGENITIAQAKDIKGALMDSMLQVPLDVRGLGDRVMDLNYKINPLAAPYARIQQAFRFAWNPIFAAKLDFKTEILSQLETGHFPTVLGTNKVLATIFPEKYAQIDNVRQALRTAGVFDEKGYLGVANTGEAADTMGISEASANINHRLLPGQERSIAAMVSVQADKAGLSVTDFINNEPQVVRDTVQAIAQYDRNANFLNSPLARTLNYAFFPFRFDIKVATFMARNLAKQDPLIQFAIIKGLYNATTWLKSDEGQAWYARNSNLIGLFKYFSPVSELSTVAAILGASRDRVSSYGELGGLPFGFIPQVLDAAGLTHFGVSAPLIDSKTGQVVPQYIPTNAMGGVQLAIEDLLGGLFTYPGATAGLPSKSSIERYIASGITGQSTKNNFTTKTPPLNAEEQHYQQVIQEMNPVTRAQNQPSQQLQPQPATQFSNIPSVGTPITTPLPKTGSASGSKTKATRLKKSDFKPTLLPGQSQYGQL